jgi:hypothetical protein
MKGRASWWTYARSGKWDSLGQPCLSASFSSGETFNVDPHSLRAPFGELGDAGILNVLAYLLGQRRFVP